MTPQQWQAQQQQLAREIEQQAAQNAVDWATVPELIEFRNTFTDSAGKPVTLDFGNIVEEYGMLQAQADAIKAKQDELRQAVQVAILLAGRDRVDCAGQRINRIEKKGARKIVAEKLLAHGVSADTIAACTDVGQSVSYIEIRRIKDKE